jgi:enamine deaminase RidA (YjgF/YER057c/UK114 family)
MPANGEQTPAARLRELGVILPEPSRPLGRYEPAVQIGSLLVLSGMLPLQHGTPSAVGRLGDRVEIEEGRAAARLAALNALAVAERALGTLDRIRRVVRLTAYMTTTADFASHAAVADGASDLFASLFDEGHTRAVLGAHSLPLGAMIELDVTFELHPETGHV